MILTKNKDYYFCCDFETITEGTKYWQEHNKVRVILWNMINLFGEDNPKFGVDIKSFFDYLFNLKKSATIWFFNLSFDGEFILNYLVQELGFKPDYNEIKTKSKTFSVFRNGSKIFYIHVFIKTAHYKQNLIFRCSYRVLGSNVENWGKIYGIKKLTEEEKLNRSSFYNVEPVEKLEQLDKRFVEYCYNDNLIIKKAYNDFLLLVSNLPFVKRYDATICKGKRQFSALNYLTISALTKKLMKINTYLFIRDTKFKGRLDYFFKTNYSHYEYMSKFFRGGFTQFNKEYQSVKNFKKVKNTIYIDVNSAYPYQMSKPLPYGDPLEEPPKDGEYATFYEIKLTKFNIKRKFNKLNLLPNITNQQEKSEKRYVAVLDKEVNFTTRQRYIQKGENATLYVLKEEWDILNKFYNFKVESIKPSYYKMKPFLSDYVNTIYRLKKNFKEQGNKAMEQAVKVLMNAGYGTLAQRYDFSNYVYSELNLQEHDTLKHSVKKNGEDRLMEVGRKSDLFSYDNLNCYVCHEIYTKEKKASNRVTPSYITAQQRVKMFEFLYNLKNPNVNFGYCDTDSFILFNLSDEEYNEIIANSNLELGGWKVETDKKDELIAGIIGAKRYFLIDHDKVIKSGFSGLNNYELLKDIDFLLSFTKNESDFWIEDAQLKGERVNGGILLKNKGIIVSKGVN